MLRLFIVIPIYAFVAIFMPRQDWFTPLADQLHRIEPNMAIIISGVGLALSGAVFFGLRRFGQMWIAAHPRLAQIILMGCLGVFIAGVFDMFERLSGYATDVVSLIVVPIAFMVAEAVYLAFDWRLKQGAGRS